MKAHIEEARRRVSQLQRIQTDTDDENNDTSEEEEEEEEVPIFYSRTSPAIALEDDFGFRRFQRGNADRNHREDGEHELRERNAQEQQWQKMESDNEIDHGEKSGSDVGGNTCVRDRMRHNAHGHDCVGDAPAIIASGTIMAQHNEEEMEPATTTIRLDDEALGSHLDALLARLEDMSPDEIKSTYGKAEDIGDRWNDVDNDNDDNVGSRPAGNEHANGHTRTNGHSSASRTRPDRSVPHITGNGRRHGSRHRLDTVNNSFGTAANGNGAIVHTDEDSESCDSDDDEDPVLREVREHNARVMGRRRGR